ncbi:MAG TPA: flavodoxin domain-containing protein [Acidimicrobiia bacterium]|nr:flavodoxin domain-containing protein [Acidimicrobiia bacterium]
MRAVVVYESMYGHTRVVAEAIGAGLRERCDVAVVPVGQAGADVLDGAELLVVGAPTHVHGLSRPRSRAAAAAAARKPGAAFDLEEGAEESGVREWLASLGTVNVLAAAFDTRSRGPAVFTGRASRGIDRELGRHGAHLVASPESFLMAGTDLGAGEEARARRWGGQLAAVS